MSETISVGSRAVQAIRLDERTVINGQGHPSAVAGVGITKGVPKEAFEKWMETNALHDAVSRGLIFQLPEDPEQVQPKYGFQAVLEASEQDQENTKLAAEGSTVKDPIGLTQGAIKTGEPDNIPSPTMIEVAQTLGAPNTPAPTGASDQPLPKPPPVEVKVEAAPAPAPKPKPKDPVMPADPSSKPLG